MTNRTVSVFLLTIKEKLKHVIQKCEINYLRTLWKKWQYLTLRVYMMTSFRPSRHSISARVASSTMLIESGTLLAPL